MSSKMKFIQPHYSRDFELRQSRIKQLRDQQDIMKSRDLLETRLSGSFSGVKTGHVEQLHHSRRNFGNAPLNYNDLRSKVRQRFDSEPRSRSRERLLKPNAAQRSRSSERPGSRDREASSLRRGRSRSREYSMYPSESRTAPSSSSYSTSPRTVGNSANGGPLSAFTRTVYSSPSPSRSRSRSRSRSAERSRALYAQRKFETALSDVIDEKRRSMSKPQPWVPSSGKSAWAQQNHANVNVDAVDRGLVFRAIRKAPWVGMEGSKEFAEVAIATKQRVKNFLETEGSPTLDPVSGHSAGIPSPQEKGREQTQHSPDLARTLGNRFGVADSLANKGKRRHIVMSAHLVSKDDGGGVGVRHGVVVVKKGCSRPDLIKSALAQFNVGGDVTDVVLSHVTDLSGTKSISYSGPPGISLLSSPEEALPSNMDDSFEVTVYMSNVVIDMEPDISSTVVSASTTHTNNSFYEEKRPATPSAVSQLSMETGLKYVGNGTSSSRNQSPQWSVHDIARNRMDNAHERARTSEAPKRGKRRKKNRLAKRQQAADLARYYAPGAGRGYKLTSVVRDLLERDQMSPPQLETKQKTRSKRRSKKGVSRLKSNTLVDQFNNYMDNRSPTHMRGMGISSPFRYKPGSPGIVNHMQHPHIQTDSHKEQIKELHRSRLAELRSRARKSIDGSDDGQGLLEPNDEIGVSGDVLGINSRSQNYASDNTKTIELDLDMLMS